MTSYVSSSMEKSDWKEYGFEYGTETNSYYPIIIPEDTTQETEKKVSKIVRKTDEQNKILNEEFNDLI